MQHPQIHMRNGDCRLLALIGGDRSPVGARFGPHGLLLRL
jgi:hypothetical protein